jgi:hypothetical protein
MPQRDPSLFTHLNSHNEAIFVCSRHYLIPTAHEVLAAPDAQIVFCFNVFINYDEACGL